MLSQSKEGIHRELFLFRCVQHMVAIEIVPATPCSQKKPRARVTTAELFWMVPRMSKLGRRGGSEGRGLLLRIINAASMIRGEPFRKRH